MPVRVHDKVYGDLNDLKLTIDHRLLQKYKSLHLIILEEEEVLSILAFIIIMMKG